MTKIGQQFRDMNNKYKFLDHDKFSSNFIKTRYFVKIALPYRENQVNNFEKGITDSNSSTPKTYAQTVSKFVILLK